MASPSNTATLAAYLDAHNNYVTQLHATNGMVENYSQETLPALLQVQKTAEKLLWLTAQWGEVRGSNGGGDNIFATAPATINTSLATCKIKIYFIDGF